MTCDARDATNRTALETGGAAVPAVTQRQGGRAALAWGGMPLPRLPCPWIQ